MAWTTPLTAVTNATLTAAQWNASVRDNLLETAPAKATTAGRFFATTGANALAERVPTVATVATAETTTSTTYTNLATSGPAVTVTTGPNALAAIGVICSNDTTGQTVFASVAISGASTLASSDANGIGQSASGAARVLSASRVRLHAGLTAGSNTFTVQYRVGGGTGSFQNREITVVPF